MRRLNQSTLEKLESYVYLLRDPSNHLIFYVGKGMGTRINSHELETLVNIKNKKEKHQVIRAILASGRDPEKIILRHGLTDKEARLVESTSIDLLNSISKIKLTNLIRGHEASDLGIQSLDELEIKYQAYPLERVRHNLVLLNINRLYQDCRTEKLLYEATRKSWRASIDRIKSYELACAVYKGIIRKVYKVSRWVPDPKQSKRVMFVGRVADKKITSLYLYKSVQDYYSKGAVGPLRYVEKK